MRTVEDRIQVQLDSSSKYCSKYKDNRLQVTTINYELPELRIANYDFRRQISFRKGNSPLFKICF